MKRIIILISALIFATACVFFIACGGIEGTYKFSSLTVNGVTINAGENYNGIAFDKDYMVLSLKKDGTFEQVSLGIKVTGIWESTESGYKLIYDYGETDYFTVNGNMMIVLFDNNAGIFGDITVSGVVVLKK